MTNSGGMEPERVVSWKTENYRWYGRHYSLKTRYFCTLLNTAFCCFLMATKEDSNKIIAFTHMPTGHLKNKNENTHERPENMRKTDIIKQRQADLVQ